MSALTGRVNTGKEENNERWGQNETLLFDQLHPDILLESVEAHMGVRCTGRIQALNSLENRVLDIELEEPLDPSNPHHNVDRKVLSTRAVERAADLVGTRVSPRAGPPGLNVIAPLVNAEEQTLFTHPKTQLMMATFPKYAGRIPDELDLDQMKQLGRTIARMHLIGERKDEKHRLKLSVEIFGRNNLNYLVENKIIHESFMDFYRQAALAIFDALEPLLLRHKQLRIHGDLHRGNILWGRTGFTLVDFDDMVVGPAVQDLWLVLPERGTINNHLGMRCWKVILPYEILITLSDV